MAKNVANQLKREVLISLNQLAKEMNRDLNKIVGDRLLETYKENVIESYLENDTSAEYGARSTKAVAAKEETETAKAYAKKRNTRTRLKYTYKHDRDGFVDSVSVDTTERRPANSIERTHL